MLNDVYFCCEILKTTWIDDRKQVLGSEEEFASSCLKTGILNYKYPVF